MNILADENVEGEIVMALRSAGHIVSDIKEISPGINDPEVLVVANQSRQVLMTNDKDLDELVYRDQLFQVKSYCFALESYRSVSALI